MTNVTMVVADDIHRYTRDCELYTDADELATEAVRTMLMDVTAGYEDELDGWLREYGMVRENREPEMFRLRMTRGMASRIDGVLAATGYGLNAFVMIAFMRWVSRVTDFEDDEAEMFGDADGPGRDLPRVG